MWNNFGTISGKSFQFLKFHCNSFQSVWWRTPTIDSLTPFTGPPGNMLYLESFIIWIPNDGISLVSWPQYENHHRHLVDNPGTDLQRRVRKQLGNKLKRPQCQISKVGKFCINVFWFKKIYVLKIHFLKTFVFVFKHKYLKLFIYFTFIWPSDS